jgi:BirA family biotin operon repressor/biotin-[acetyl-CoA-carboxylase] ligase
VVKVLNQKVIKAGLKWPNDIYYQNKKLGGILLEVTGQPSGPVKVVMGIGLNIKMPEQAETQIDQVWIDLKNKNMDRNDLTVAILETLSSMILDYQINQLKIFYLEWQKYDIWTGRGVYLIQGQTKIAGICRGIDNLGALCLEIKGQIKTFQAGEVSLRKQE